MTGEPGSKLDFSTFISYILPGYILGFCFYSIFDIFNIYLHTGRPVAVQVKLPGAASTALIIAASALLAYFLGLMLDALAHTSKSNQRLEDNHKAAAYINTTKYLVELVVETRIQSLLSKSLLDADNNVTEDYRKVEKFIDAMFYRLATAEVWARHNWSWAFYEATRQLTWLLVPFFFVVAYWATLNLIYFFSGGVFSNLWYYLPPVVALVFLIVALLLSPKVREESRITCQSYYNQRVRLVFAYLTQVCVLGDSSATPRKTG